MNRLVTDNSKEADDSVEGGREEMDKPTEGLPIEKASLDASAEPRVQLPHGGCANGIGSGAADGRMCIEILSLVSINILLFSNMPRAQ